MDITANDVVRRYLYGLMQGRFSKKTDLADGMGTSRAQLQESIRQGHLTVKQMNSLAESMGSSVWGVLKELAGLAEQMEKGRVGKLTAAELDELLGGRERRGRNRPVLQGELDEAEFSADADETTDEDRDDGPPVRVERQPQPRRSSGPRSPRPR